jgi:hypothetical protein
MSFEFSGQHSAMVQQHNTTTTVISLLDNAFGPGDPQITHDNSRGLLIALDTTAMSAETIAKFPHPDRGYAKGRGNLQMLPNGHAWLCWTHHALLSEHRADGSLVMKAGFRAQISSYRSWKLPWTGRPSRPPDVHAAVVHNRNDTYTIVHMSWNGATEVKEWHVYHCDEDAKHRKLATKVRKYGFETGVWTEGRASHVIVVAVGEDGDELGESRVFPAIPPAEELSSSMPFNTPDAGDLSKTKPNNADSDSGSWLIHVTMDPMITFFVGFLLCLFSVSIYLGIRSSLKPRWWKRRLAYEPVPKDEDTDYIAHIDHESIELQQQDEHYVLLGNQHQSHHTHHTASEPI